MRNMLLVLVSMWCGLLIGMEEEFNPLLSQFPEGMNFEFEDTALLDRQIESDDQAEDTTVSVSAGERVRAHDGIFFDDHDAYEHAVATYIAIASGTHTSNSTQQVYRERIRYLDTVLDQGKKPFEYDQFGEAFVYGRNDELVLHLGTNAGVDTGVRILEDDCYPTSSMPPRHSYTAYSVWYEKEYDNEYYVFAADDAHNLHAWRVPDIDCWSACYQYIDAVPGEVTAIRQMHGNAAAVFFKDQDETDRAGIISWHQYENEDGDIAYKWAFDTLHQRHVTQVINRNWVDYEALVANQTVCRYIRRYADDRTLMMPGPEGSLC